MWWRSMKFEDDGSFSPAIAQWKEVLGILVSTGGPALPRPEKVGSEAVAPRFLESMKGIAAGCLSPRPCKWVQSVGFRAKEQPFQGLSAGFLAWQCRSKTSSAWWGCCEKPAWPAISMMKRVPRCAGGPHSPTATARAEELWLRYRWQLAEVGSATRCSKTL